MMCSLRMQSRLHRHEQLNYRAFQDVCDSREGLRGLGSARLASTFSSFSRTQGTDGPCGLLLGETRHQMVGCKLGLGRTTAKWIIWVTWGVYVEGQEVDQVAVPGTRWQEDGNDLANCTKYVLFQVTL